MESTKSERRELIGFSNLILLCLNRNSLAGVLMRVCLLALIVITVNQVCHAELEPVLQKTNKENPYVADFRALQDISELLGTSIHGSVDIDIPMDNGTYTLGLLLYEGWRPRATDIVIEGKTVIENFNHWKQQGKTFNYGSVVAYD
jgi:hypothetical protein